MRHKNREQTESYIMKKQENKGIYMQDYDDSVDNSLVETDINDNIIHIKDIS